MLTSPAAGDRPLVDIQDVVRHFRKPSRRPFVPGDVIHALDGVSFSLRQGCTLGLVGESGSGKSTLGRIVLGIDRPTRGHVLYEGRDVHRTRVSELRRLQREMQMVFQDPSGALDPRMMVEDQIREPLDIHEAGTRAERRALVDETIAAVRLPPELKSRYPHELSGGQQQRVVVARALILRPKLIVCDEPISALDVSIQAQVINLLDKLQDDFGLTYLFISHDLKVVRHISDVVAVMYLGQIVEIGPKKSLFRGPLHPYTQALISAIPVPDPSRRGRRTVLGGEPPSPLRPPPGCRFHPRCPHAAEVCRVEVPPLRPFGSDHFAACHFAGAIDSFDTAVKSAC